MSKKTKTRTKTQGDYIIELWRREQKKYPKFTEWMTEVYEKNMKQKEKEDERTKSK